MQDIPTEARIASIADVYDALATKRPYADQKPFVALKVILEQMEGHFDRKQLDAFIRFLCGNLQYTSEVE